LVAKPAPLIPGTQVKSEDGKYVGYAEEGYLAYVRVQAHTVGDTRRGVTVHVENQTRGVLKIDILISVAGVDYVLRRDGNDRPQGGVADGVWRSGEMECGPHFSKVLGVDLAGVDFQNREALAVVGAAYQSRRGMPERLTVEIRVALEPN
jgi:hypothetical protein